MKTFIRVLAIVAISLAIILSVGFIVLKRGISVSELSISNIQIRNTYLAWDNKLKLEIEKVTILPAKEKNSSNARPSYVRDALRAANLIEEWFTSIDIKKIAIGPLNASFQFREHEDGQLSINSPQLEILAKIGTDAKFLLVDIEKLASPEYKSHAQGKVRIDTDNRKLTATFEAMIADTLPVQLEVKADRTQLSFSGHGKQSVTSIAPIVEVFNLGPDISPWISDYLTASEISLTTVSGSIPYDKPASILQTLHAVAKVKDTEYTFAQGLEPIKALETDVVFEQAVLKIRPRNAHFYGQDTGGSELDINFSKNPFVLTAYIRTKAQASGGTLTLLDFYGIPFPFEQKEGLVDTDLKLAIDLSTIDIKAKGTFKADSSVFEFDKQLIDVKQLDIGLNSTDITVHKLDISKKGLFLARITGELDTAKSTGELQATIDEFQYQSAHSELLLVNPDSAPLNVKYHMRPEGDSVSLGASSWKAGDVHTNIAAFTTPFDHKTLSGKLPPTAVTISPWLKTNVSGTFQRTPPYADLDITLLDLTHDALRLEQAEVEMGLVINDDIRLTTKASTAISSDSTAIKLLPTEVMYAGKTLHIKSSGLELDGQFFSDITGQVDINTQTGKLVLGQLRVTDKAGVDLLAVNMPLPLSLSLQGDRTKVSIPTLGIEFQQENKKAWTVDFKDLSRLNKFSPWMQDYKLKQGEFSLTSQNGSLPWSFNGKLTYPSALLIEGDRPIHDYQFSGSYDGKSTNLDINEKVHVKLADEVSITSDNIGYNLPALFNINTKQNKKPNEKNKADGKAISLALNAKNSFIYLSNERRILADELKLTLDQGLINCDLKFGDGFASLQFKDNKVSLAGKDFDKSFLNGLLTISEFSDGKLDFQLSGSTDNMDAVMTINDAVLQNYGLISNVLAFINTVPALLTFRLPGFHSSGLYADEITAAMNIQDGLIMLKSFSLDSKQIDIRGEGNANMNDDTIDITLNLITGAKKSMGHIPLLGYVLSGDKKKPSITLTVKGDMKEPEISHTAFKEVATYPFQLLKRTIILPGHLVQKVQKETADESTESSNNLDKK
ncbi:MAG: AsmA-like C-terminal domain-containing protein [Arenicellales bacterium]